MADINRYTTWELDDVVEAIDPMFTFLTSTFFGPIKQFATATIEHDIVERGRRIAPFVSPHLPGKPTRRPGYRTFQIKPSYIKLLDTVRPEEGWTRVAGEKYGGELSPQERLDRAVAEQIVTHDEMIAMRIEKMASDVLFTGELTITDDDYPTSTVDFERDPNNSVTVGTAWGAGGATPLADIQSLALQINQSSRGAVVTDLVMRGAVFDTLMGTTAVRDLLDVNKNLSPGTSNIETGPRANRQAQLRGRLSGQFDLWTYDGYYEDDTAAAQVFVPANKVLFVANGGPNAGIEGRRYFGAIQDMDAQMKAKPIFVKSRRLWNPSGEEVLTQTAPMVGMRRPNASGVLTVA